MKKENKLQVVCEFLEWLDENRYEIGEDCQSDYGDGQSTFYARDIDLIYEDFSKYLGDDQ